MENIFLILNIIFAIILVLLVLMQKSEGGALGIGVSQENFMFSRSAGNFMTKATAIVATLFIICSTDSPKYLTNLLYFSFCLKRMSGYLSSR